MTIQELWKAEKAAWAIVAELRYANRPHSFAQNEVLLAALAAYRDAYTAVLRKMDAAGQQAQIVR